MEGLFSLDNKFGEHRNEFRRNGGQKNLPVPEIKAQPSKTRTAALCNIIGTYTHRHLVEGKSLQSADGI
jgi:hypothetical protein